MTASAEPAVTPRVLTRAEWSARRTAHSPLVSAELVGDCFALAREIRTLDMRASPYDLAALGYPSVPVETPEGRAEYAAAQRAFAERAAPLRHRLIDCCEAVLGDN